MDWSDGSMIIDWGHLKKEKIDRERNENKVVREIEGGGEGWGRGKGGKQNEKDKQNDRH